MVKKLSFFAKTPKSDRLLVGSRRLGLGKYCFHRPAPILQVRLARNVQATDRAMFEKWVVGQSNLVQPEVRTRVQMSQLVDLFRGTK